MDAIYYDTQSYTTEDVRTRRGVCVRKATKDDEEVNPIDIVDQAFES